MKTNKRFPPATLFLILQFVFAALSFAGAVYVLVNKGEPGAGYAVIPMLFSVVFGQFSLLSKKKSGK